jgi:trigger factor
MRLLAYRIAPKSILTKLRNVSQRMEMGKKGEKRMQVSVQDTGPCRKTLDITVPAEKVMEDYDRLLAVYRKSAKVPGFRPGKAPKDLVARRYQKEIVDDLQERLVSTGYHDALEQEKLNVVTVLDLEEPTLELGKPVSYKVTVDVMPEINLPAYEGIKIKAEKVEVKDEELDEVLTHVREQHATFQDIDGRAVQKGDLVQVDYDATIDGKPMEETVEDAKGLGQAREFFVFVDDAYSFIPGFVDGLVDMKIGDEKDLTIEFPEDYAANKNLAGQTAVYHVKVGAIREKVLPEVSDEEFLKRLDMESEDALKEAIMKDLQARAEMREQNRQKEEIIQFLLKDTKFDLPASVVDEETRQEVYNIVRSNTQRGVERDTIEEKKDEIFKTASQNAGDRVKLRYILHAIADKEEVDVARADMDAEILQLSMQYRMAPAELRKELEKRNAMDNIKEDVRNRKTVDFLLAKADISE